MMNLSAELEGVLARSRMLSTVSRSATSEFKDWLAESGSVVNFLRKAAGLHSMAADEGAKGRGDGEATSLAVQRISEMFSSQRSPIAHQSGKSGEAGEGARRCCDHRGRAGPATRGPYPLACGSQSVNDGFATSLLFLTPSRDAGTDSLMADLRQTL